MCTKVCLRVAVPGRGLLCLLAPWLHYFTLAPIALLLSVGVPHTCFCKEGIKDVRAADYQGIQTAIIARIAGCCGVHHTINPRHSSRTPPLYQ